MIAEAQFYNQSIQQIIQIFVVHIMQKKNSGFEERKKESQTIKKFHPDKVPIIVTRSKGSRLRELTNNKFLMKNDFNVYKMIMVIKNKIQLDKSEAIYLFINKNLLQAGQTFGQIYQKYEAEDGFLHIQYFQYATFGTETTKSAE